MKVVGEDCAYPLYIIRYTRARLNPQLLPALLTKYLNTGEGAAAEWRAQGNKLVQVTSAAPNTEEQVSARVQYTCGTAEVRETFRSFTIAFPAAPRARAPPNPNVTGMGADGSGYVGRVRPPDREEMRQRAHQGSKELNKYNVGQLKTFLAQENQSTAGKKSVLVARVQALFAAAGGGAAGAAAGAAGGGAG